MISLSKLSLFTSIANQNTKTYLSVVVLIHSLLIKFYNIPALFEFTRHSWNNISMNILGMWVNSSNNMHSSKFPFSFLSFNFITLFRISLITSLINILLLDFFFLWRTIFKFLLWSFSLSLCLTAFSFLWISIFLNIIISVGEKLLVNELRTQFQTNFDLWSINIKSKFWQNVSTFIVVEKAVKVLLYCFF